MAIAVIVICILGLIAVGTFGVLSLLRGNDDE